MRLRICGLLVLAGAAVSSSAGAQATSWLYMGGGSSISRASSSADTSSSARNVRSLVQLDVGLGVPADQSFVWGGIATMQLHGNDNIDLGFLARGTTGGYARGDYGLGFDIGVVRRLWAESKTTALIANLVFGGPWGLTLSAGATVAGRQDSTLQVSLGIDFARLTVHRTSGLNWFPNPLPSPAIR